MNDFFANNTVQVTGPGEFENIYEIGNHQILKRLVDALAAPDRSVGF
jgi:hypothetical protein